MNHIAEDHLDHLIALFVAEQRASAASGDPDAFQDDLESLHRRQPEILLRLFRIERAEVRQATAAVVADLLHDPDPIIRKGIYHSLMITRTSLFLKPLYEYLQQNGYSDDVHTLARITARVACPAAAPTYACVGRNTVLAWRLVGVLAGLVYHGGLP
jgi:hypothetical protein